MPTNLLKLNRILPAGLLSAAILGAAVPVSADATQPQKMSAADLTGKLFTDKGIQMSDSEDGPVKDFTSLLSSDGKFASGMYEAGPSRSEITEPYGVDEFMYFLEGGVTLTSSDGTVIEVRAGDAITVPKEWTGIWQTEGYRKIWVIYSDDGSALE